MALPPDFPQAPVPPSPRVRLVDPNTGLIEPAWADYHTAVARFLARVRDRLDAS